MRAPLLEVENLTVQYETDREPITAVANASFTVDEGDYFGLVGESGCGKSTMVQAILGGLDANGSITNGTIRYRGEEIQNLTEEERNQKIRWKEISWIPQSSMNSLDPLQRVAEQALAIGETHSDLGKTELLERLAEMFEIVGIQEERIWDYPHQFSGGMRQRALIALALFLDPDLIIADEPTTALDVIMQDQVFKYLDRVNEETGTSMVLITHDISVVFETCNRLAIMHGGQIAEVGTTRQLYHNPHHPYSILLQEAFPDVHERDRELVTIQGIPPQNLGPVTECTFADRCPWAVDACYEAAPPLEPLSGTDEGSDPQLVACIRKEEIPSLYESTRLESYVGGARDE